MQDAFSRIASVSLGPPRLLSREHVPKKPASLLYGVDEHPPLALSLVLALQHVIVVSVGWIFVVLVVNAIGGTNEQAEALIRCAMLASGVATILQAMTLGPMGSGYLCPVSCGPAYIPAAILAGKSGGLSLLIGMTGVSGCFEFLLSRVIRRLRVLFPPEVTGLVVAMVGIALVRLGCTRFFGFTNGKTDFRQTLVAIVTLAVMVAPTVWSRGKLRLFPVLVGLCTGYAVAFWLGVFRSAQFHVVTTAPLLGLPRRAPGSGWSFEAALLVPFLIASLSSVLKTVGDLTLCQKINNAEWKRTGMESVSGGVLASSIGTGLSALLGGPGQSTFSSNIGLSMATGVTSRSVALPIGLMLMTLAFVPKLAAAFSVIPTPVMGAVLVYVACFMILGGLQVMTSRMLDVRRTFVVGIAMVFGLSVDMIPGLYAQVPSHLQPLFSSELSLATVLVVVLNLLFRIGVAKTRTIQLFPQGDRLDQISRFMEEQGASWGMRKEVEARAVDALYEALVSIGTLQIGSPVTLKVSFDEFNLEAEMAYEGPPILLPNAAPTPAEWSEPEQTAALLAGFIIRQNADAVFVHSTSGHSRVQLRFEH